MRIRTILAAAAAPAALAAVLLGTAGQASAAVNPQAPAAAVTASVKQAVYKLNVHQHGVADTTDVQGSATLNNDPTGPHPGPQPYPYGPIGPVWAFDNMERQFTATQDPATHIWTVTETVTGSYSAFANPITGDAWTGTGPVSGTISYTVKSDNAPVDLPAQLDSYNGGAGAQFHTRDIVQAWFGASAQISGGDHYHFEYKGIPGGTLVQDA
jgi:hypothetical protein